MATTTVVPPWQQQSRVQATATAISPTGAVYSAYSFNDTIWVAGQPYSGSLFGNCVLIRHDASAGAPDQVLLTGGYATTTDVATDAAGNVYAIGVYNVFVAAGSTTLQNTGGFGPNYFFAKWDAAGTLQWLLPGTMSSVSTGAWDSSPFGSIAVDAAGNVTVAGTTSRLLTIGTVTLAPSPGLDVTTLFCAQFLPNGTLRWAVAANQPNGSVWPTDLAIDPATGDPLVVGRAHAGDFRWYLHQMGPTSPSTNAYSFWLRAKALDGSFRAGFSQQMLLPGATLEYAGPFVAAADNGCSYLAGSYWGAFNSMGQVVNGALVAPANTTDRRNHSLVVRLDGQGHPQWARLLEGPDSVNVTLNGIATMGQSAIPSLAASGPGPMCYLTGSYTAPHAGVSLGNGVTLPATTRVDGFVGALDGLTGEPRWALPAAAGVPQVVMSGVAVNSAGQVAVSGNVSADSTTLTHSVAFGNVPLDYSGFHDPLNKKAFTAKLDQQFNQMQGLAFIDADADGTRDAGEAGLRGLVVEAGPEGTFFSTAADGGYSAVTDLGQHTVSLPVVPPYHTLTTPAPAPAVFSTYGMVATGRDFGLHPQPNQQDLQVFVTPVQRARPGLSLRYRVTYRNVGTTTVGGGTVRVQLDSVLTYLSNNGGGTLSGHELTVPYTNLAPGATGAFDVQLRVRTTTGTGTVLVTTATIDPVAADQTPADNTETNRLTVTAPYDPNDIQVNWPVLTPAQVTASEWLEYTIRFENTGTDTAFSVMLRDSLPLAQLGLGTLQVVASSHSCTWRLLPGGLLVVQFPNIRLPYRNIDALRSTGFVRFRVRALTTLVLGDVVPNAATIHFDYSPPMTTNTALTTVGRPAGLNASAATAAVSVWPNPAHGTLQVESSEPQRLTLLDALGRPLRRWSLQARREAFELSGLAPGVYLLRSEAASDATYSQRLIIN